MNDLSHVPLLPEIRCTEILGPGPHDLPITLMVMVGAGPEIPDETQQPWTDENGQRHFPPRACSPESAVRAAAHLIRCALASHGILTTEGVQLGAVVNSLWPVLRDQAYDLVMSRERGSKGLRSYVEREVQARVLEELASRREAARLAGLGQAQDTIRRLWAIASEDNPSARAVALAAIAGEVRSTVGPL